MWYVVPPGHVKKSSAHLLWSHRAIEGTSSSLEWARADQRIQLAIATLSVTFAGAYLSTSGKKAENVTQPPINAKSKEEESFVKYGHPRFRSIIVYL